MRARMSARGSRPKIASFNSISTGVGAVERGNLDLHDEAPSVGVAGASAVFSRRLGLRFGRQTIFAGLRRVLRQRLLHRVADINPAAGGARHRAFDEDEAALDIGLHDTQIQGRHAVDTHVTGHLLVLEGLARILTAAGRTHANDARSRRRGSRAGRRNSSASYRRQSPCPCSSQSRRRTGRRRNDPP